jgi:hypothetical protein
MHLHCSVCGHRLNLILEGREETKSKDKFSFTDKEPTGADCRYITPIQVEPCQNCELPVMRLKQVVNDIKNQLDDFKTNQPKQGE